MHVSNRGWYLADFECRRFLLNGMVLAKQMEEVFLEVRSFPAWSQHVRYPHRDNVLC